VIKEVGAGDEEKGRIILRGVIYRRGGITRQQCWSQKKKAGGKGKLSLGEKSRNKDSSKLLSSG